MADDQLSKTEITNERVLDAFTHASFTHASVRASLESKHLFQSRAHVGGESIVRHLYMCTLAQVSTYCDLFMYVNLGLPSTVAHRDPPSHAPSPKCAHRYVNSTLLNSYLRVCTYFV